MPTKALRLKSGKTVFFLNRLLKLTWSEALTLVLAVCCGVALLKALPFSLRLNTTESLPLGLYVQDFRKEPALGRLVIIPAPTPTSYADPTVRSLLSRNRDLLKPIGAMAGEYITNEGFYTWSCPHGDKPDNRCRLLGVSTPTDSTGRKLTPWPFKQTRVPEGMAYVGNMTVHPRSFDSRYLGLVPIDKRRGVVFPLLTE